MYYLSCYLVILVLDYIPSAAQRCHLTSSNHANDACRLLKEESSPVWPKCYSGTFWHPLGQPRVILGLLGRMSKAFSYEIESSLCVILNLHKNILASCRPSKIAIRLLSRIRISFSYDNLPSNGNNVYHVCNIHMVRSKVEMGPPCWLSTQMQHMLL